MKLPAIVRYVDDLPIGVGGSTLGPYVKIWTKCKGDKGSRVRSAKYRRIMT